MNFCFFEKLVRQRLFVSIYRWSSFSCKKNFAIYRIQRNEISARHLLSAYHCTYNHESGDGSKPCDHSDGGCFFLRQISSLISMSSLLSPCLDDDLGKRVAVLGRNDFNYREALIGKYYSIPIIGDIINSASLKV